MQFTAERCLPADRMTNSGSLTWTTISGHIPRISRVSFDERSPLGYATFGFNDDANLDEGTMWPTSWALTKLTAADEKRIAALVKKAVS